MPTLSVIVMSNSSFLLQSDNTLHLKIEPIYESLEISTFNH